MKTIWIIAISLMIVPCTGCSKKGRVNFNPGFAFRPQDRIALIDASDHRYQEQGKSIVNYLTNEFVGMNIQVVERSLVDRVLQEKGLDPKTASASELIATIASYTNSNLVGIHVVESFSSALANPQKPHRGYRYKISGFLRVINKEDNKAVVSGTFNFNKKGKSEQDALQKYALMVFNDIQSEINRIRKQSSSSGSSK